MLDLASIGDLAPMRLGSVAPSQFIDTALGLWATSHFLYHRYTLAWGSDIRGSYGVILNNRMITMARAVRRKVLAPQRLLVNQFQ